MARVSAERAVLATLAVLVGVDGGVAAAPGLTAPLAATSAPAAPALAPPERDPACGSLDMWVRLIDRHVARYPALGLPDAYKLLHQATMGSEHAVPSRDAARAWLAEELEGLGDGPEEPLVDRLGEDARVVRIHIRPFRAAGGSPERLLDAFVETARLVPPDPGALECALDALVSGSASGDWPWDAAEAAAYARARTAEGYPAVHHSDAFIGAYRPAYRVVAVERVAGALEGIAP